MSKITHTTPLICTNVQNPEKAAKLLPHQLKWLSIIFSGEDTENGQAMNESCVYTVSSS